MKILISTQLGLGNAVLLTAFIKTLLEVFDQPQITLIGKKNSPGVEFLSLHPGIARIQENLDSEKYDIGFLPFLGNHTRLLEQLFWTGKTKKIISHTLQSPHPFKQTLKTGYMTLNKLRGIQYIPVQLHQHEVWNYLNLLEPLGIPQSKFVLTPDIPASMQQKAVDSVLEMVLPHSFFTVQCMVSNTQKTPKSWPVEYWGHVLTELLEQSSDHVVFVGTRGEEQSAESVIKELPSHLRHRCLNLSGKTTIESLTGVLKKSRYFIGADSGIAHLSAALQKKTMVLWGPSPWGRCHPIGSETVYANLGLPCSPCVGIFHYTDQEAYDRCAYQHRCMSELTPNLLLNLLKQNQFSEI